MKKILLLIFACTASTTISYAGGRLEMLDDLYNTSKNKGTNKQRMFNTLLESTSEDYRTASSRVQNLIKDIKTKKILLTKHEDDRITLKEILKNSSKYKKILEAPLYSHAGFKDSIKSLTSELENSNPEFPCAASQGMLDFLEEKNERYGCRAEMVLDFYSKSGAINRWERRSEKEEQEKNPFKKIAFYQKLLDSIDKDPTQSLMKGRSTPFFFPINYDHFYALVYKFFTEENEKIEDYGKVLLDVLKQEFPNDAFFSAPQTFLASALDKFCTLKIKKDFEHFNYHEQPIYPVIDFLIGKVTPSVWELIIKKRGEVLKANTEDLTSFLQEHINKWNKRLSFENDSETEA